MKKLLRLMLILAIVIIIILLLMWIFPSSLDGSTTSQGKLNEDYVLHVGDSITIEKYTIKLLNISDSRCPSGAQCIWTGELTYKLDINDNDYSLGIITKQSIDLGTYQVILVDSNDKYIVLRLEKKG
jgi:hypothetical protein